MKKKFIIWILKKIIKLNRGYKIIVNCDNFTVERHSDGWHVIIY